MPLIRFHSVIDSPDSVSLVTPPRMTIPKTRDDEKRNHLPTGFVEIAGKVERGLWRGLKANLREKLKF